MIVVVGGGPAGLAASLAASEGGSKVLLVDSSDRLGGQFWRHMKDEDVDEEGKKVLDAVRTNPNIAVLLKAQVWRAVHNENETTLHILLDGASRVVTTDSLILATGAYDRTLPFPGWDIPGVMTAGAAQALLKSSGVVAGKKIVIAGTGPFLLPVTEGLSAAGAKVVALYEANNWSRWMANLPALLANPSKVFQALSFFRKLKRRNIRCLRSHVVISANAGIDQTLSSVTVAKVNRNFSVVKGTERIIDCDCLAVSWGFTADLSVAGNLGLSQKLGFDGGLFVEVNSMQETSKRGVFAVGEVTGIGGSELAAIEGRIAGYAATDPSKITKALLQSKKRKEKFAEALLRAYPVMDGWRGWLDESTIICRCEEVSLKEIIDSIENLSADTARTTKMLTRAGMGMCQGRMCSRSIVEIVAVETGVIPSLQEEVSFNNRSIVTPILLEQLAASTDIEYISENE